jgi:hypothetical protein
MTSSALPKKLQQADYNQRVHEMVLLGLRAQQDKQAAQLIAALADGKTDERWLALKSCFGSRDQALIVRFCHDPSLTIQRHALNLLARFADDTAVSGVLADLGPKLQRLLLRVLAKYRRTEPIDRFIQAQSAERQIKLLPFASPTLITQLADSFLPRFSSLEWASLARLQPRLAYDWLQKQLQAKPNDAKRWLLAINTVLAVSNDQEAERAFELVKLASEKLQLSQLSLGKLIYLKSKELAELAIAHKEVEQVDFSKVMGKLSYEQIEEFASKKRYTPPQGWLHQISPAWRATLYQKRQHAWRDQDGTLHVGLIKLLPSAERIAEARRNLKLPEIRGDQYARIFYAALLPWQEAEQELQSSFGHNEPSYRAAALAALIDSARYEDRQNEVLALLERRRNEQDPVRQAMLGSLAGLPPSRWKSEHLAGLDIALSAALNAGDLSNESLRQIQELLVRVLAFHSQWSINWMIKLWETRRFPIQFDCKRRLSQAQFELLEQAFLPIARKAKQAGQYDLVINIAQQLEERLQENSPLSALLEELLSAKDDQVVQSTLYLLQRIAPKRLLKRLPDLVQQDPSFIRNSAVYELLHTYNQEPLAQTLALHAPQGRFNKEGLLLFLPINGGFIRWTRAQQKILAHYLERIIYAPDVQEVLAVQALEQLSQLPSIKPKLLIKLASLGEERAFVRERALRALGRLDNLRAGIGPLIDALGDSRARFAIYALRSALLQLPASEALAILKQVPSERVTVAKEALRLVGELGTPEAFAHLIVTDKQELHRDVRIALLRALWDFLEYDQTWEILEAAARSEDGVLAKALTAIPNANGSAQAQERILGLTLLLLQHPDPEVRIAAIGSLYQRDKITSKQSELEQALLQASMSKLPKERRTAIFYIFSLRGMNDSKVMSLVTKQLLQQRSYRWLSYIADHIQPLISGGRKNDTKQVPELIKLLKTDPYTVTLALRIASALQDWELVYDLLEELRSRELLHSDMIQSFERGVQYLVNFNRACQQFESRLASHSDARFRRLALTLLAQEAGQTGWKKSLLKRLEAYRADPDPLVAGAAYFIFPPESDEEEADEREQDWPEE